MDQTGKEHLAYLRNYINPILNEMCLGIMQTRPRNRLDIINTMLKWLT